MIDLLAINSEREYHNQWRESHREKGLCIECNRPATGGHTLCLFHLDYKRRGQRKLDRNPKNKERRRLYDKVTYYKRKSENRCVDCGMPLSEESRIGICCINCSNIKKGY